MQVTSNHWIARKRPAVAFKRDQPVYWDAEANQADNEGRSLQMVGFAKGDTPAEAENVEFVEVVVRSAEMQRPTCKTCPYYRDAYGRGRYRHELPTPESPDGIPMDGNDFCGKHPDFPAYLESRNPRRDQL